MEVIFEELYDAESIIDLEQDIYNMFTDTKLDVDKYGFIKGEFKVTITHTPDEEQPVNSKRKDYTLSASQMSTLLYWAHVGQSSPAGREYIKRYPNKLHPYTKLENIAKSVQFCRC